MGAGYLRHQIISTVITIISKPYRSNLPQNPDHAVQYSTIHCITASILDLSTILREASQGLEKLYKDIQNLCISIYLTCLYTKHLFSIVHSVLIDSEVESASRPFQPFNNSEHC